MTLLSEHGNDQTRFDDAELKDTDAESFYLKDTISAGKFTHILGVRYEDTEKNDGTNANPGNSKQDVSDSATIIAAATTLILEQENHFMHHTTKALVQLMQEVLQALNRKNLMSMNWDTENQLQAACLSL